MAILPGSSAGKPVYAINVVYGKNGIGKTILSLTASAVCPPHITDVIQPPPAGAAKTLIPLTDMIIIQNDRGGDEGMRQLGIDPTPALCDFSGLAPHQWLPEFEESMKGPQGKNGILERVASGGIKLLTFDLTGFDVAMNNLYVSGAANKRDAFSAVSGAYGKMWALIKQVKCEVLVLGHQKVVDVANEDPAAARQRKASGIPAISLKGTGGGAQLIRNDVSRILYLDRETDEKPARERLVLYAKRNGYETKLRGGIFFPDKMPGDLRVVEKYVRGEAA